MTELGGGGVSRRLYPSFLAHSASLWMIAEGRTHKRRSAAAMIHGDEPHILENAERTIFL